MIRFGNGMTSGSEQRRRKRTYPAGVKDDVIAADNDTYRVFALLPMGSGWLEEK